MRYFGSKVYPKIYGGHYFITSEDDFRQSSKIFTIRKALPDGQIETVGKFGEFQNLKEAKEALHNILATEV